MLLNLFKPVTLPKRVSVGLLLLRLVAGVAFMHHGWGKIHHPLSWMPPEAGIPSFFLLLAALSEFGGGLAWILGLLTPLASFGVACTMIVAVHMHAMVRGDPFVATEAGQMSFEPALGYLSVALLLLLSGPGRISLDCLFFGEKSQ